MSKYFLNRTLLSPCVAASVSVSHLYLTRAASSIWPRRDKLYHLRREGLVCLNDSRGRCLVLWLARSGCSEGTSWDVGNRRHRLEHLEEPQGRKREEICKWAWEIVHPSANFKHLGHPDSVLMVEITHCESQCSDLLDDKAGRRKTVCQGCCSCHIAPLQSVWLSAESRWHSRCQEGTETAPGCRCGDKKDRRE